MAASTRGRVSHSARHPGEQPVGAGPSPGPKAMSGRGAICADGSAVMQRRGQKRMRPQSVRSSAAYRSQMRDVPDERAATWEPVIPRAAHKKTWRGFYASPAGSGANGRKLRPAPGSAFLCPVVAGAGSCAPSTSDIVRMNGRPTGGHIGTTAPLQVQKGLATAMVALTLRECRRPGIARVLLVCRKGNPASARIIAQTAAG